MTIIRQVFFAFAAVLISTCAVAQEPVTAQVTRGSLARSAVYEGHIEAVTQTSIAAQSSRGDRTDCSACRRSSTCWASFNAD